MCRVCVTTVHNPSCKADVKSEGQAEREAQTAAEEQGADVIAMNLCQHGAVRHVNTLRSGKIHMLLALIRLTCTRKQAGLSLPLPVCRSQQRARCFLGYPDGRLCDPAEQVFL